MCLEFGKDPMDRFSEPVDQRKTKLSTIFSMDIRAKKEKPGRELAVVWDERNPLVKGFENQYSYVVTFSAKGNIAGNHYHKHKEELFYPLLGEFTVFLEDVESGACEEMSLKTSEHEVFFIPKLVSHTVRAESSDAILLVVASAPGTEDDEFEHVIVS